MFVSATNNPLENDEIRTLKQTSLITGYYFPVCFNSHFRFSLRSEDVQKEQPVLIICNPKKKTMKTFVTLKQNLLKSILVVVVSAFAATANAQTSTSMQADNGSLQTALINTPTSFTAILNNNNKVDLKWSTEIESNLSHIMVEKSTDGKNYKDAALVFTYGTTIAKSDYGFADNISKVKSRSVYYRLKTVNGDGSIQYSDARIVKLN